MDEALVSDWEYQRAQLFAENLTFEAYPESDIVAAADRAADRTEIRPPDIDGYVVPLFEVEDPTLTNEYVVYEPETERIGWKDTGTLGGVERKKNAEELASTEIAARLRRWMDDAEIEIDVDTEDLPAETVHPQDSLSETERDRFFEDLRAFVESERDSAREEQWSRYRRWSLDDHVRSGTVAGPFAPVGHRRASDGNPAYKFQYAGDDDGRDVDLRDDENLFEETRCILDIQGASEHFPVPVRLTSVGDTALALQPESERIDDATAVGEILESEDSDIWLTPLLNPVPYDRRLDAIRSVEATPHKRDLLTGKRAVGYSVNKFALPESSIALNEYQRLGTIWADGADDVVCIHGPPGTGKTRTLTAYVEAAVRRGQSVLVTAHSNQAVDNLLVGDSTVGDPEPDTLHGLARDDDSELTIARVGSNTRDPVVQEHYLDVATSTADVVASTTSGAAQFDPDTFDVAVVDEATQASRPATAIVLDCAEKLVLAGDHKQLPPYCADESMQDEDMHVSLFEYLLDRYSDDIAVQLRKQYRMNEAIAAFPNEAFYDGRLETAAPNRDWTVADLGAVMGVHIDGVEKRPAGGESYANDTEAEAAAKQVERLVREGLPPEDIGVISAYSGQVSMIRSTVDQLDIDDPQAVDIDTVDSFQGSEREAIVVSFVRSNDDGHSGFLEFPSEGPRRLNVALTRARRRLVLVGDWETLGTVAPHRSPKDSCADVYAALAEHLRDGGRML